MLTQKLVNLVVMVVRTVRRRPLLVLALLLLALLLRHCLGTSTDTHIRPSACPVSDPKCNTDPKVKAAAFAPGPSGLPR